MKSQTRIMYIENKNTLSGGYARIGRVKFSKLGASLFYNGKSFHSIKRESYTSNYYDIETGEEFWISGCKENGQDRLQNRQLPVFIDENVKEEYWTQIRNSPNLTHHHLANF